MSEEQHPLWVWWQYKCIGESGRGVITVFHFITQLRDILNYIVKVIAEVNVLFSVSQVLRSMQYMYNTVYKYFFQFHF